MKRTLLLIGVVVVLLFGTAACGGLNKDEQKAADDIAKNFAGAKPSTSRKAVAGCFGENLVSEAGLDQLTKDKVVDKKGVAAKTLPNKLSKKTAQAYGDAIVKCYDFDKLKSDIKKSSGASDKQVNAYVKCMDAINDDDLKQTIVDGYTKTKPTATVTKVNKATQACGQKLGS
jgi:predicted small secreted protein